jgi:hypothetical protein
MNNNMIIGARDPEVYSSVVEDKDGQHKNR